MNEQPRVAISSGIIEKNGERYMADAQGRLTPVELIKPQDQLMDDMVRKIVAYGQDLSDQVRRFKEHCFEDVAGFIAILDQEYNQTRGGKKGNMTFTSYDGCLKVTVQVADNIEFGPELQIAKELLDECLTEWSADARPELRAIVTRAFNTDKPGQVNRAEIFMLLRLDIEDTRWQRAMQAIRDAMRVVGSKSYVRCYRRDSAEAEWQAITIDMARA